MIKLNEKLKLLTFPVSAVDASGKQGRKRCRFDHVRDVMNASSICVSCVKWSGGLTLELFERQLR